MRTVEPWSRRAVEKVAVSRRACYRLVLVTDAETYTATKRTTHRPFVFCPRKGGTPVKKRWSVGQIWIPAEWWGSWMSTKNQLGLKVWDARWICNKQTTLYFAPALSCLHTKHICVKEQIVILYDRKKRISSFICAHFLIVFRQLDTGEDGERSFNISQSPE